MPQSNAPALRQHVASPTSPKSHVRPVRATATDSDPSADELLHRARNPRGNWGTCPVCHGAIGSGVHQCKPKVAALRLETELAYLLRDRQTADAARREIVEYAGVAA